MADAFRPDEMFAALAAEKVHFVLIGVVATTLHGEAGVVGGLDIAPALDASQGFRCDCESPATFR